MKKLVSLIIIFVTMISLFGCGSVGVVTKKEDDDIITRKALIAKVDGTVLVNGDNAYKNQRLAFNQTIESKDDSYCYINVDNDKVIKVLENSVISILEFKDKSLVVRLNSGSLYFNVSNKLADDEELLFETENTTMSIRGTTGYLTKNEESLEVIIPEGEVKTTVNGTEYIAEQGNKLIIDTNNAIVNEECITVADLPQVLKDEIKETGEELVSKVASAFETIGIGDTEINTDIIMNNDVTVSHIHDTLDKYYYNMSGHYHICSCGEKFDFMPHNFSDETIITNPTENREGMAYKQCYDCGFVYYYSIPSLVEEHTHKKISDSLYYDDVNHYYLCSCGDHLNESEHTFVDRYDSFGHYEICEVCGYKKNYCEHEFETDIIQQATCDQYGIKTYVCSCGYAYREELPKLEHEYNTEYSFNEADHYHECIHCGSHDKDLKHVFNEGVDTIPATCTSKGIKTYTCSCGYSYTEEIDMLEHEYFTEYSFNENYHYHECINCGNHDEDLRHVFDDGVVTTPATCTSKGIMTYTCSCGYSYTEEIHMLEHEFDTEFLYTENGHYHKCLNCDATTSIEAHSFDEGVVTTPATCTSKGIKTYTCSCGYNYTEEIDMIEHVYSRTPIEVIAEPTCVDCGYELYECIYCGARIVKETAPLGHLAYNAKEIIDINEETGDALYEWVYCERCCQDISGEYISGKEHVHIYGDCKDVDGVEHCYCYLCGKEDPSCIDGCHHSGYVYQAETISLGDGTFDVVYYYACDHCGDFEIHHVIDHDHNDGCTTVTCIPYEDDGYYWLHEYVCSECGLIVGVDYHNTVSVYDDVSGDYLYDKCSDCGFIDSYYMASDEACLFDLFATERIINPSVYSSFIIDGINKAIYESGKVVGVSDVVNNFEYSNGDKVELFASVPEGYMFLYWYNFDQKMYDTIRRASIDDIGGEFVVSTDPHLIMDYNSRNPYFIAVYDTITSVNILSNEFGLVTISDDYSVYYNDTIYSYMENLTSDDCIATYTFGKFDEVYMNYINEIGLIAVPSDGCLIANWYWQYTDLLEYGYEIDKELTVKYDSYSNNVYILKKPAKSITIYVEFYKRVD